MKKTQLQDWRNKTLAEFNTQLEDLSAKLTGAYLARSANKLENTAMIKNLRRDIAQLRTLQTEKATQVAQTKEV